jgi:N utilization substance protein B
MEDHRTLTRYVMVTCDISRLWQPSCADARPLRVVISVATGRRIARELAAIVLPQVPKDRDKLEQQEIETLIARAVRMLCDNARQDLADADSELQSISQTLADTEVEHPQNSDAISDLKPVPVTTGQLRNVVEKLERAVMLAAEALDVPDMALLSGHTAISVECKNCKHGVETYIEKPESTEVREYLVRLLTVYHENRRAIDEFIKSAKSKWNVDRMVTIDRDILRLACAEAFFITDVPVNVCISEAVELAHRFADDKAAKFINGVLADLSEDAKYFRAKGQFKDRSGEVEITTGA